MPKNPPDIFISYAHVDNQPLFDAKAGWVSTLVDNLRKLLAQKLGRNDDFTLWWDKIDLQGNHVVTDEIKASIQRSSFFLLILSPGYLDRDGVRRRKSGFYKQPAALAEEKFLSWSGKALNLRRICHRK